MLLRDGVIPHLSTSWQGSPQRNVMGCIPSSQSTRWRGSTKRVTFESDTFFFLPISSCRAEGQESLFILICYVLLRVPQVTHKGFRGRCQRIGSNRENRQAVSRYDQMVDEVLQADLYSMWNKVIRG